MKKQNRLLPFIQIFIVVFIFLSLDGCYGSMNFAPNDPGSTQGSPSSTEDQQRRRETLTPVIVMKATSTLLVRSATVTPSPSKTSALSNDPTTTSVPTLPREEANRVITELLRNNGQCKLPCWFGVTPGISTWSEAKSIFEPFAEEIIDSPSWRITQNGYKDYLSTAHGVSFVIPGEDRRWGGLLIDDDGIISLIQVDGIAAKHGGFTLANLLKEFGQPDAVYLHTTIYVPVPELPFQLFIYYKKFNILAYYSLDGRRNGDQICASPSTVGPILWLWANNSRLVVENDSFPEWAIGPGAKIPLPIDKITKYNTQSFYETFQSSNLNISLCAVVDK